MNHVKDDAVPLAVPVVGAAWVSFFFLRFGVRLVV